MNEIQRQAYLSALGIDNYMPRWILPGAPIPRACVMPELPSVTAEAAQRGAAADTLNRPTDTGATAQPPLPRTSAAPAGERIQVLDDLILDKRLADKSPGITADPNAPGGGSAPVADESAAAVKSALSAAATATAATGRTAVPARAGAPLPVPRFTLSTWRISDELLVVDSRAVKLALPTDRLLANILFALGYRLPALPKADILRWPMLENAAADQSEAQARDMLHGYLDAQLRRRPARFLLLMGREAAHFMLPEPPPFTELLGQSVGLETLAVRAIVIPSLAAMLREPAQKAIAWRAIQPLRIC